MTKPNNDHPTTLRLADAAMLDPSQRDREPKAGDVGFSTFAIRAVDVDARTVTAVVSTPDIDRYEEIVEPKAFKKWLKTFMGNPVFCAGHQYVGRAGEPTVIGHWTELRVTDEGLVGTAQFANSELGEQYWQLYRDAHMRAFSVGWITHNYEMREFELEKGVTKKIRVFTEVELVEISAVAVPANREALVRAAAATLGATLDEKRDTIVTRLDTLTSEIMGIKDTVGEIALRNEGMQASDHSIADQVIKAIKEQLSADPGGELAMLIQDVVEASQCRARGHSDESDDVTPADDTPKPKPVEKVQPDPLRRLFVRDKE